MAVNAASRVMALECQFLSRLYGGERLLLAQLRQRSFLSRLYGGERRILKQ